MNENREIFLETANRIGVRLCRDALWDGARCNWLGDSMEYVGNAWTVTQRTFGPDLYSGTSGIALFLARLFGLTQERLYRTTAEGGLRQAWSRLEDVLSVARVGFYSGLSGIAYVSITFGEIFANQKSVDQGLQVLESLTHEDVNQEGLDVIAGSAGAIPALLDIYRRYPRDFLLDLAIRHGEHLLDTARKSDIGWSWDTLNRPAGRDLTGFSHGTAGIGWALLELSTQTGQERFGAAAQQAFRYEQHWFSAEYQNWPDLRGSADPTRNPNETPNYTLAWCHGAPGIGLSRVRAFALTGDAGYKSEAEIAVRTTETTLNQSAAAGQSNFSLCHGLGGNAELLIYASQVLGNAEYKSVADRLGESGIEWFERRHVPWPCGVVGGGETPNLMLGIAGIGYFYLRLFDPARIPPVMIVVPEGKAESGQQSTK